MPLIRGVGGVEIHYRVSGADAGAETLMLFNGVGDDLEAWAPQMDDLLAAGLRVVTIDNRGSGRSGQPPGPYTSREMAEDAKAVADDLALQPFHLAGVSMGGVIAQEYAVAHPDDLRSVVFANTYAAAGRYTAAAFSTWALVAETAGMEVMLRQMAPWIFSPAFYERDAARVERLVQDALATTQPPEAFVAQTAALITHDCRDRLGSIRTPALVIAAADDIIIRPDISRALYEALPQAEWVVVEGGHAAFWENPVPWNRSIIDFVNNHSALT